MYSNKHNRFMSWNYSEYSVINPSVQKSYIKLVSFDTQHQFTMRKEQCIVSSRYFAMFAIWVFLASVSYFRIVEAVDFQEVRPELLSVNFIKMESEPNLDFILPRDRRQKSDNERRIDVFVASRGKRGEYENTNSQQTSTSSIGLIFVAPRGRRSESNLVI
ncbi:uncharacterized protein LOC111621469 isoform X2 [Centruroides sculpturatus]|uniref:uncharacterized protein LOC111621469 isoform X2 n=1 Tax=Centruroides sculpturatus TaxID=218467 RepID=UPI000C6E8187|nr:uncharacterized protein LOC111621469 isoform X2 [Centruroides sculpturatus]